MTLLLPLALIIALAIGAVVYWVIQKCGRPDVLVALLILIAGLLGLEAAVLQMIVRVM